MIAWARRQAQLSAPQKNGSTLREELVAAGRWAKEAIEGPSFPESLGYLWAWWLELTADRGWSDHGVARAVTWEKVHAWKQVTGARVQPFEARALVEIDRTWRSPGDLREEELGAPGGPSADESIWPEGWRD